MDAARDLSDRLALLLHREHGALAEFLVALADFDQRQAWRALGYPSLFVYLTRHLGVSSGSAHYRSVAARLVRQHPAVLEALAEGKLCFTVIVELAKVLTPENEAEVLPRFFHRSKTEARAITAELQPRPVPERTVVTAVPAPAAARTVEAAPLAGEARAEAVQPVEVALAACAPLASAAPAPPAPRAPPAPPRSEVVPLTADLRRLHLTVPKRLLEKLEAARDALSHAMPGASGRGRSPRGWPSGRGRRSGRRRRHRLGGPGDGRTAPAAAQASRGRSHPPPLGHSGPAAALAAPCLPRARSKDPDLAAPTRRRAPGSLRIGSGVSSQRHRLRHRLRRSTDLRQPHSSARGGADDPPTVRRPVDPGVR